jgi:hypothetical protein
MKHGFREMVWAYPDRSKQKTFYARSRRGILTVFTRTTIPPTLGLEEIIIPINARRMVSFGTAPEMRAKI